MKVDETVAQIAKILMFQINLPQNEAIPLAANIRDQVITPLLAPVPADPDDEKAAKKWRSYTLTELLYTIIGACEYAHCGESKKDVIYRIKGYAKQALKLPDANANNDDDEGESIRYSNEKQGSSTDVYIFSKMSVKNAFLAGCAHKAGEVEGLREQLEESLLLYNNMTHNITTLNAEIERLKADNAKYGDMASALSKAAQEIERLRQALNQ